jgi:hypothetical protein
MQTICPTTLILRSPNCHVKSILHINTEDVAVTRQIAEAGKLLDVEVLDHLIIGNLRFVSLKERGLGFG